MHDLFPHKTSYPIPKPWVHMQLPVKKSSNFLDLVQKNIWIEIIVMLHVKLYYCGVRLKFGYRLEFGVHCVNNVLFWISCGVGFVFVRKKITLPKPKMKGSKRETYKIDLLVCLQEYGWETLVYCHTRAEIRHCTSVLQNVTKTRK